MLLQEKNLRRLYCERRLSMMEAAKELNVSQAKVLYWLKKFNIPRRSWKDSAYIKQNPRGDPFNIPERLNKTQKELLIVGLSLYWAEGNKGKEAIRIANLDHRMLAIFLRFLREVCQIDEKRLCLYVRVHKDFSLAAAQKYWADFLSISLNKVFVYTHTDTRSKKRNQKSEHGIATLEFHSTKLKQWLDSSIDKMVEELSGAMK